jgi:glycosyltransferase involved in cell wall biosynthesis
MARVCVVRQHYVPRDTRVARELAELVAAGHRVDVICLRDSDQPLREVSDAVHYWRVPLRHAQGRGRGRYLVEYATFFVAAAVVLAVLQPWRRYRLVQVNSLPDVLVFAAVVPRVLGARVLLDLQECMPEFFATKFGVSASHPVVRLLARLEQLSIRFADHAITPTEQMRQTFISRGARPDAITVVMDGSDSTVFTAPSDLPGRHPGAPAFTLVSHGTVEEHYGLDTVVRAVALLREEIPGLRLEVYGTGSHLPALHDLTTELGADDAVRFSDGFVPLPDLVRAIAAADAGVIALRRDPFRDVALPGKIFDFVLMRKPVISSRTRSVEEIFGPDCVELFESGDAHDLARAIRRVSRDADRRAEMVRCAETRAEPLQWARQRRIYRAVVGELLPVS